jgi:hypothetical protein
MASLTIKKLEPELLERLREQAREQGLSMNSFLRQLLARCVGLEPGVETFTDLSELAGSWNDDDEQAFLEHTRPFREIDETLWR